MGTTPISMVSGLVLTRRDLFTLLGSAAVLVACGGKSHTASPSTASSGTLSGAAASAGTAGNSGPPLTGGASTSASGNVVQLGGPHATGSDAISVAEAEREEQTADGHWQGGWHDATGASGDSDLIIAIDGASRTAKVTVSFGGKPFGAAIPAVTYDIDLLSFMLSADSYTVSSPQFGQVTAVPGGSNNASGTLRAIPGQPTIDHVDVNGTRIGQRVDVGYTVQYTDGHSVKGTMAWTASGARAIPAALGSSGAPTTTDISSGTYAAELLDAKSLTTIFGEPFSAPTSNGGNLLYDNGIATSNARATATSGDYVLQYTVYVGTNAADTAAFWAKQNAGLPTTPGPWESGFYFPGAGFYAELPTRVLLVNVVQLKATAPPTPQQLTKIQQWATQVATALTTSLKAG
ncbi:MAG TPA: hypothetical protein VK662_13855 [Acidothermaceae bacterium]|nr:hypothetical protein [Acidothermaceae bacterium]